MKDGLISKLFMNKILPFFICSAVIAEEAKAGGHAFKPDCTQVSLHKSPDRFWPYLLIMVLVELWSPELQAACIHSSNQAAIYQDGNLSGNCRVLNVGWYANSSSFGLPNDSISSLSVGANVRVTLYKDENYKGEEAFYEGGSP